MGIKFSSVELFFFGIVLLGNASWGEEVSAIPRISLSGSAISSTDVGLLTTASIQPPKEADKDIDRQEIKTDKEEVVEDETIIEAWMRDLSQKALKCFEEDGARIDSLLRSAKGIVWVVPETLGTLLGVHAGSALGFYRKSDQHWGLPIVHQVESEIPLKWGETKLLMVLIFSEKDQVSMLLPQWPYAMEKVTLPEHRKNSFWVLPESKDFPREIKLSFHFNREINEELYGVKNIRAIDIVFNSSEAPPCLRALWNCLEALK
jgi:hypothetical protein